MFIVVVRYFEQFCVKQSTEILVIKLIGVIGEMVELSFEKFSHYS